MSLGRRSLPMGLGHVPGRVSEAQLRKNFKIGAVMLTAIALLSTFWAWGEIDKAYFGQVYDAHIVEKWKTSRRTTYHIRYSYVEDRAERLSHDIVDVVQYERFAPPRPATTAPTGKVKVGKALGCYFDQYFEGEFQPEKGLAVWIAVTAGLAWLLTIYFLLRPLFGRLSDPVRDSNN